MGFFKKFKTPKIILTFAVDKNQLSFGDEIRGVVALKCEEELDIDEINASLTCVESIKKTRKFQEMETTRVRTTEKSELTGMYEPTYNRRQELVWKEEDYFDNATLYSDHLRLSGSLRATIGLVKEFPFMFKMPLSGRETYHSVDSNLRWSVSAFAKVKDRKNIYSHCAGEILVSKPISTQTPIKEVVKEVVLIPCAYCSGLMPQTSIFCPNCGARRKN